MGYYTTFKINVIEGDEYEIFDYIKEWNAKSEGQLYYAIMPPEDYHDECKWYSYEKEMKKLSRKFKDALIELTGEGEEAGDMWKEYYKGGKVQRCTGKITYDEYDEGKLK